MNQTKTTEMLRSIARSEHLNVAHAVLFLWAEHRLEVFTLSVEESVILGRGAGADMRVDNASVSRHHARFSFDGAAVHVQDLGSRNGTSFQGERVSAVVAVADGAHVLAGDVAIGVRVFAAAPLSPEPLTQRVETSNKTGTRSRMFAAARSEQPRASFGGQAMSTVGRTVERLATLVPSVLVLGETGTGKELVARALHERGPRAKQPFRALNCGAIPATLLEGVFFGYLKGAFTGADQARGGIFEEAGAGTVFLDEIGELSLPAQTALLRVLENRTVARLGSNKETPIEARVVAATHRDLDRMVAERTFREDLLHRLNAFTVELPPLRERKDEIRGLSELFVGQALAETARSDIWVDDAVWPALESATWPGNVRELRNTLMRAVALCEGEVLTAADLRWGRGARTIAVPNAEITDGKVEFAELSSAASASRGLKEDMRERELSAIRAALATTGGHKGRAAELLGMPIRTFRRRLRELEGPR